MLGAGGLPLVWALRPGEDPVAGAARLFTEEGGRFDAVHSLNETYSNALLAVARDRAVRIPEELQLSVVGRAGASGATRASTTSTWTPCTPGRCACGP